MLYGLHLGHRPLLVLLPSTFQIQEGRAGAITVIIAIIPIITIANIIDIFLSFICFSFICSFFYGKC